MIKSHPNYMIFDGIGTNATDAHITSIGQIYYNVNGNIFRKCVSITEDLVFEDIIPNEYTLYISKLEGIFIFNNNNLIRISNKIKYNVFFNQGNINFIGGKINVNNRIYSNIIKGASKIFIPSEYEYSLRYYNSLNEVIKYTITWETGKEISLNGDNVVVVLRKPDDSIIIATDVEILCISENVENDVKKYIATNNIKSRYIKFYQNSLSIENVSIVESAYRIHSGLIKDVIKINNIPEGISYSLRYYNEEGICIASDTDFYDARFIEFSECKNIKLVLKRNNEEVVRPFEIEDSISAICGEIDTENDENQNLDLINSFTLKGSFASDISTYDKTPLIPVKNGDCIYYRILAYGGEFCKLYNSEKEEINSLYVDQANVTSSAFKIETEDIKYISFCTMNSTHEKYINYTRKLYITNNYNGLKSLSIRACKEINSKNQPPHIETFLLEEYGTNNFYLSNDLKNKKYIFTFNSTVNCAYYSFAILPTNDIIAVYRTETIDPPSGSDDSVRKNPYVFLAQENYSIQHEVDFGDNLKPSGWLQNCGFRTMPNGDIIFCEYTRPSVKTANVWKISANKYLLDYNNWRIVKQFTLSGDIAKGFKHCHTIQYDFYTGIIYLATGDDNQGAYVFYSNDGGENFKQAREPSEKYCRLLNFSFTKDYIYWATDTDVQEYHYVFRCKRDNDSGIIDYSTVEELANIPYTEDHQATYGTALIPELNILFLIERCDGSGTATSMPVRVYDFEDNELKTIGTLYSALGKQHYLGFRCEFSEFYPIQGKIRFGFGSKPFPRSTYVNFIEGFNNEGFDRGGVNNINNLELQVFRQPNGTLGFRLNTYYL